MTRIAYGVHRSLLSAAPVDPWRRESIHPGADTAHRRPAPNRHRHPSMGVSRRGGRPRGPATPSMNVATTRASPIAPAARSNRSRSRTDEVGGLADLERADLGSRWLTQAVPTVNAASASMRSSRSSGRKAGRSPRWSRRLRSTATSISEQRVRARDAPVRAHRQHRARRLERPERVLPAPPLAPRNGIVRTSIWSSWQAHSGCALAATPSSRKRPMSSGWMTWMWAMCGRVSDRPLARRAASTASSASRTARSPMAWKCGLEPERVEAGTHVAASAVGSIWLRPRFVRRAAVGVAVRLEHGRR